MSFLPYFKFASFLFLLNGENDSKLLSEKKENSPRNDGKHYARNIY